MKTKTSMVTGFWLAGLMACFATAGCDKPQEQPKAADSSAAANAADAAAKKAAAEAEAKKAAGDAKTASASLPTDVVQFKSEILRALAQTDMTMAKLEVLSASTGSLKQPSKDAVEAIDALDKESASLKQRGADMRERGAAYFENWEKQLAAMTTPGVVSVATKRKDELSAKYADLLTAMQAGSASFDALWADLQAIQKAADDDLDEKSLKGLAPQIQSAKEKAAVMKERVQALTSKLDQVGVIYTKP